MGPFVRALAGFGITPNMLTVSGVITNAVAGVTLVYGHFRVGGVLILLGGLCDLLDGALARTMHKQSSFGKVLDSTFDRYSDTLPILGLMLFYSGWSDFGHLEFGGMILCGLFVLGSLLIPYVRAKAESLGQDCDVGLAGRAERVIIFAIGLITNADIVALWILAVITHLTVLHRLLHVRSAIMEETESAKLVEGESEELPASDVKTKL